jgi:hypothetical protein
MKFQASPEATPIGSPSKSSNESAEITKIEAFVRLIDGIPLMTQSKRTSGLQEQLLRKIPVGLSFFDTHPGRIERFR